MSHTVTRPLPRESQLCGHAPQQAYVPQAIPVQAPVPAGEPVPVPAGEPEGQRRTYLERKRTVGLASRRVRDLTIVAIVIGVPLAAAVPLVRYLKRPLPVEGAAAQSTDNGSNTFSDATPTGDSQSEVAPSVLAGPEAPAHPAVDVYEFLTIMRGHPFIAEEDKQRLLGSPASTVNSDRGGLICTHWCDGGLVMYRYDPEGPGVIRDVSIRKATEQPRDDFESGAFDVGYSSLRVKEYRDYCLAMMARSVRSEPSQDVADKATGDPPTPTTRPTDAPQNLTVTAAEVQSGAESHPVDNGYRTWASADGRFACEAKFLKFEESRVYLQKTDQSTVAVSMYAFSAEDQFLIREKLKTERATPVTAPDTAQTDSGQQNETIGGVFGSLFSDAS